MKNAFPHAVPGNLALHGDPHRTGGTILIVDDNAENIRVVGATLRGVGFDVMVAKAAEEALERMEARLPDLLLLDINLPGKDGITFCSELKGDPGFREIPVLFLSAEDSSSLIVRALESGGADYVTKPFNKAELISRVRTHLHLKGSRDALEELVRAREEFVAMLAHDLKNPLSGLYLSAQLLAEDRESTLSPNAKKLVQALAESSDKLLAFLSQFLEETAGRAIPEELHPVAVDAAAAARGALARFEAPAADKEISLTLQVDEEEQNAVFADPLALTRVLDNLVSNAVKFSPSGSSVALRVVPDPAADMAGTVTFAVTDEGPGLTDHDKSRLFERFARLSARPTSNEPSTGLGLSIVKKLSELMGGEIRCESEHGAGATFIVTLPAATAEA